MLLTPTDSLSTWEKQLREQFYRVELICEVAFDQADLDLLRQRLSLLFSRDGSSTAIDRLIRLCPATLSLYLVAEGVYGFVAGDYWTGISERYALTQAQVHQLGQAFEAFLTRSRLPSFDDVQGLRFLKKILAHGGIPNYCLDDFYAHMLQPAVTRHDWAGLTTRELLEEWQHSGAVQAVTDKPVLRFLFYGGRIAADFLDRCREMALQAAWPGEVGSAEEYGLPARVVDHYRIWLSRDTSYPSRPVTQGPRWSRPVLALDPWGEGVHLVLPSQKLLAASANSLLRWRVSVGTHVSHLTVQAWPHGLWAETEPLTAVLPQPASQYDVALVEEDRDLRSWTLAGISADYPALAFHPDTGRQVLPHQAAATNSVRLLLPPGHDVRDQLDHAPRRIEELPMLPGYWSEYRVMCLDLGGVTSLKILGSNSDLRCTLPVSEPQLRTVRLGGAAPLQADTEARDGIALYGDSLPSLMIPVDHAVSPEIDMDRWRIVIRPQGPARPSGTILVAPALVGRPRDEGSWEVPLCHPELLGTQPMGEFHVVARGPLGRDTRLKLRVMPGLDLTIKEGGISVQVPAGSFLTPLSHGDRVRICLLSMGTETDVHRIELDEGESCADLNLRAPAGDVTVDLPIFLRFPRLRWALVGLEDQIRVTWSSHAIGVSLEALRQANEPELMIDTGALAPVGACADLRLLSVDGTVAQQVFTPLDRRGRGRLPLGGLRDALGAMGLPVAMLQVAITNSTIPTGRPLTALTVEQIWRVHDISVEPIPSDSPDECWIHLQWREQQRLTQRAVEIWSLWRPWVGCQIHRIDDAAAGAFNLCIRSAAMPPGSYRLRMVLDDPWASSLASRRQPAEGEDNVHDFLLGSTRERADYVDRLAPTALGYLQRFLAGTDAGSHDWAALRQVHEVAQDADIPQLVEVLVSLTANGSVDTAEVLEHLRRLLLHVHPEAFLQALAERTRSGLSDPELRTLVNLLVAIGWIQRFDRAPAPRQAGLVENLWQVWPPLGLSVDLASLGVASDHYTRLAHHLGTTSWLQALSWAPGADIGIDIPAVQQRLAGVIQNVHWDQLQGLAVLLSAPAFGSVTLAWCPLAPGGPAISVEEGEHADPLSFRERTSAALGGVPLSDDDLEIVIRVLGPLSEKAFGGKPEDHLLALPREVLQELQRSLNLVPRGVIDSESYLSSNFEWLLACKIDSQHERRAVEWVTLFAGAVRNDLDRLVEASLLDPRASKALGNRWFSGALNPLQNLPFLVGAVALAQCALGYTPAARQAMSLSTRDWVRLGQAANEFAPRLYVYDLCISELLWHFSPPPGVLIACSAEATDG